MSISAGRRDIASGRRPRVSAGICGPIGGNWARSGLISRVARPAAGPDTEMWSDQTAGSTTGPPWRRAELSRPAANYRPSRRLSPGAVRLNPGRSALIPSPLPALDPLSSLILSPLPHVLGAASTCRAPRSAQKPTCKTH